MLRSNNIRSLVLKHLVLIHPFHHRLNRHLLDPNLNNLRLNHRSVYRTFCHQSQLTEIHSSALAGDGTRCRPSLPIAHTITIPFSDALLTKRASAEDPLSPVSSLFGQRQNPKTLKRYLFQFDFHYPNQYLDY